MTYPYTGRDLFEEPESYSYASCAGADFLNSWKESRKQAMERLGACAGPARPRAGSSTPGDQPTHPADTTLQQYLGESLGQARSGRISAAELADRIEPFVVKYEVFKRLHSRYDTALRRLPDAHPADLNAYLIFGLCLEHIAAALGSLKHLSCLLKLCDALANKTTAISSPTDATNLAELLKAERALVEALETER